MAHPSRAGTTQHAYKETQDKTRKGPTAMEQRNSYLMIEVAAALLIIAMDNSTKTIKEANRIAVHDT